MGVPFRFGYAIDVDYTLSNSGEWFHNPNGRVWKLNIKAPNAYSLNFIFEEISLSDSTELYIYNQNRTMVYGPLNAENTGESRSFGTDLIQGEQVIFELFEPNSDIGKNKLKITKAIHGYKDMFNTPNNFGDALECHNNINCPSFSAWQGQSNSVALVLLADNTRLCSGALLNNTCGDFTPNFLTAFHCIDIGNHMDPCEPEAGNGVLSVAEINRAQNWVFRFQYKSPTCTPSAEPSSWVTFNGSTFRAGWFDTDFALVEMNQVPPASSGIQYAGWSRSTAAPTSGANIHHPRGDVMKISTYNSPATNSVAISWRIGDDSCPLRTNTTPANTHWTLTLTNGTTEGGSSGSPLFDQNKRVVGQLHGGFSGCAPIIKHYGKLDRSWGRDAAGNFLPGRNAANSLAPWLDPNNTGAMTTDISASITGSDVIFCTTETYTLSNLPTGSSVVSWSATPSSHVTLSGSGNSRTVTRNAGMNGYVTLTATISTDCGNVDINRTIYAGVPFVADIGFENGFNGADYFCDNYGGNTVHITTHPEDAYLDFEVQILTWPGMAVLYTGKVGASGTLPYVPPTLGLYMVRARVINHPCGTGDWSSPYGVEYVNCAPGQLSVRPNPANETITVTMVHKADGSTVADEADLPVFTAVLYDGADHQIRKGESKGGTVRFDTQDLPDGTYRVEISQGDKIEDREVVIKR